MPAYVVYINGHPGVGKLTIARQLQKLIPGSEVLHNHELIDPVEKHTPRGSARYQLERAKYRQRRLKPIMEDPKLQDTVYIFTDSQTEYNECVSDYTDLCIGDHSRRMYSVILECELNENIRRLTMPDRGGSLNGKLTDVELLKEYRTNSSPHEFLDDSEIYLDVTSMAPEAAAKEIKKFVDEMEELHQAKLKG